MFFNSGERVSVDGDDAVVLDEEPVDPDGPESPGREVRDVVVLQDEDVNGRDATTDGQHGLHDPPHHAVRAPDDNRKLFNARRQTGLQLEVLAILEINVLG